MNFSSTKHCIILLSILGIDEVLRFHQIKNLVNDAHHTVLLITTCVAQMAVYMTVENTRILDPLQVTDM